MDASVKAALAQWPNVPDCHGWLSLDERGRWRMQGKPVSNLKLIDFIGRNYFQDQAPEGAGDWIFQNGPQKVHVELALTPWVISVSNPGEPVPRLITHTGQVIQTLKTALVDETGALLFDTDLGPALVDDRDLMLLMPAFSHESGDELTDAALVGALEQLMNGHDCNLRFNWQELAIAVTACQRSGIPKRFGYLRIATPA